MAKNSEPEVLTVDEGATYEAKTADRTGDKRRLVAFFVDRPGGVVRASPIGSGAEERFGLEDFLNDFEKIADAGEALPEDRDQEAPAENTEDRSVRTPLLDTTKASPTREGLEERAAKRNR